MLSLENLYAYFSSGIYVWLSVLALVGFVTFIRSGAEFWRIWSIWAWSYLASMTIANGFTHFPWYFVPLLPIYTAAATLGVERLIARAGSVKRTMDAPVARAAFATLWWLYFSAGCRR
jgi:hypothetical protein